MTDKEKKKEKAIRNLLGIEYDHEIDYGEFHGPKEEALILSWNKIFDADYECFDDLWGDLVSVMKNW